MELSSLTASDKKVSAIKHVKDPSSEPFLQRQRRQFGAGNFNDVLETAEKKYLFAFDSSSISTSSALLFIAGDSFE